MSEAANINPLGQAVPPVEILQAKHEIVVVPTVIIFKDGEEVKRFQADISFSMKATRKDMQEIIDELIMSDF